MKKRSHWTPLDWKSRKYCPSISCSHCSEQYRLNRIKQQKESGEK